MSHDYHKPPNSSAPYSPALSHYSQASMAEQNNSQSRQQPTSYPSPHSYPSPSMQPTYTYPPPQGQSGQEPYRASPTGSNMSLPSLNLPPIRLQDGQGQPPPQPQPGQQPMGSPLPPPVAPMSAYYPPHPGQSLPPPGQQMNITSSPHNLAMRYQLPPQGEPRMMSGGRHKKEIKRRTKTGCLTCRKRRIKVSISLRVCYFHPVGFRDGCQCSMEEVEASRRTAVVVRNRATARSENQNYPTSQFRLHMLSLYIQFADFILSRLVRRSSSYLPKLPKEQARVHGL